MIDLAALNLDTIFDLHGADGVVKHADGRETPCKVFGSDRDRIYKPGVKSLVGHRMTFHIRVSEVPDLAEGDVMSLAGVDYPVRGVPMREDPERLVWTVGKQ